MALRLRSDTLNIPSDPSGLMKVVTRRRNSIAGIDSSHLVISLFDSDLIKRKRVPLIARCNWQRYSTPRFLRFRTRGCSAVPELALEFLTSNVRVDRKRDGLQLTGLLSDSRGVREGFEYENGEARGEIPRGKEKSMYYVLPVQWFIRGEGSGARVSLAGLSGSVRNIIPSSSGVTPLRQPREFL